MQTPFELLQEKFSSSRFDLGKVERNFISSKSQLRDKHYGLASREVFERLLSIRKHFDKAALFSLSPLSLCEIKTISKKANDFLKLSPFTLSKDTIVFDPNFLPLQNKSIDLFTDLFTLNLSSDPKGFFLQAEAALKEDGFITGVCLGSNTFREIKETFIAAESELKLPIRPHIAPLPSLEEVTSFLFSAGFALPVVDRELLRIEFDSPEVMLKNIKDSGLSNFLCQRHKCLTAPSILKNFYKLFDENFPTREKEKGVQTSLEFIFYAGFSPSSSQPKALSPGSATHDLSKALDSFVHS